jgi:hypothetical protein
MSVKTWWDRALRKRASTWTFQALYPDQTPDGITRKQVRADAGYLHIVLHSMRVLYVRKGLTKFFGTVHSFISLLHRSGQDAAFHMVTTPGRLKDIDAANVDRVIVLNQRLLGPIPYRGGDVNIELGLFSIKSTDLAAPFLDVLENLASAAGVSYVSMALPFVEPLKHGMDQLIGAAKDSTLEIGLSTNLSKLETGYYIVMRAAKGEVDPTKLKVAKDYQLQYDGRPVSEYPYMVFSIDVSSQRDDWYRIPELVRSYGDLNASVQSGDLKEVKDSFAAFRRAALTSPDLLIGDAKAIIAKVDSEVETVLGSSVMTARPRSATRGRKRSLRKLSKLI